MHTSIHSEVTGTPGIPARNGFTAYTALSSVTGFLATVAGGSLHQLDTSIGVSGPHGFAVRIRRARLQRHPRPPHPAPTFVTMANAPPWSRTAGVMKLIWVKREAEYF
jgi:hypothetical protein